MATAHSALRQVAKIGAQTCTSPEIENAKGLKPSICAENKARPMSWVMRYRPAVASTAEPTRRT